MEYRDKKKEVVSFCSFVSRLLVILGKMSLQMVGKRV